MGTSGATDGALAVASPPVGAFTAGRFTTGSEPTTGKAGGVGATFGVSAPTAARGWSATVAFACTPDGSAFTETPVEGPCTPACTPPVPAPTDTATGSGSGTGRVGLDPPTEIVS